VKLLAACSCTCHHTHGTVTSWRALTVLHLDLEAALTLARLPRQAGDAPDEAAVAGAHHHAARLAVHDERAVEDEVLCLCHHVRLLLHRALDGLALASQ
jgi:hypothetical protein